MHEAVDGRPSIESSPLTAITPWNFFSKPRCVQMRKKTFHILPYPEAVL